jgi:uncharacterized protein
MAPIVETADGVAIRVRLTPSGGADRIEGVETDSAGRRHLKARVRAVPEDGRANAALEVLIAKALGVPKSRVQVARGATARIKSVEASGVTAQDVRAHLLGERT